MSSKMHFDTPFSFEKSVHILQELTYELIGRDHRICDSLRSRDYSRVISFDCDYVRDRTAHELFLERQVLALFQKNSALPLGIDTAKAARDAFISSEDLCRETNKRFRMSSKDPSFDSSLVYRVMRKVSDILGPLPDFDTLDFGFGPGANVGVSRFTSIRRKLSAHPTCTAGAWKYLSRLSTTHPHWANLSEAVPCDFGVLASVPKNAKTDRSIVVEPIVNTYIQKGIGAHIRNRLRKFGCNLNDQRPNQEGAREGSITGELATIDLRSASDTISREVVKAVLPYDWWSLMNDVRSDKVKIGDTITVLQKFSSMGNGFTFELESLIFFALCKVICGTKSRISVYGDDIIIEQRFYNDLVESLKTFGFEVNSSKSFVDGPFRESCGRDFFGGIDIRPCYVKGLLSVKEIFRLHNFFFRRDMHDVCEFLIRFIPKRLRLFGPEGFGDGHLLGDHPTKIFKKDRGWGGYVFRTYSAKPHSIRNELSADYPAFLYLCTRSRDDWSNGRLRPLEISSSLPSQSIYYERSRPRFRVSRIYTLGTQ